ncbi:unnamed protein product [Porites evermanni]|uniref:R3H domain-containing protein n=1 Tax=Porites evermanni TaxID=104178 RepID=A0ABN8MR64_9CNID|nr:unnamed protein product [Porites evermanni]
MAARYVPPGARSKEIQGCNSVNQAEDRQRSLAELVAKDEKTDIFTVKLRSDNSYDKIAAFTMVSDTENSDHPKTQQFELPFGYKELRQLMQWFREIGWKDQDAVLQFPASLTKEQRKLVHETAQSFGLGTSSSGFKETRYISVYSVEQATLGVGKVYLTKEEREKANTIWRLVKHEEDERYKNFSHNEIDEMVLANKLDPLIQELWEKKKSLSVEEDFKEKCKVADEK